MALELPGWIAALFPRRKEEELARSAKAKKLAPRKARRRTTGSARHRGS